MTGIVAICIFLIVVMIHELGHFLMAKSVGIKVNEFSIGMGPKIYQSKKTETKYSLRLLPIGGYVSMEGEDETSNDPRSFNNAPIFGRIGVIIAGPIMNFALSIIILTIVAFGIGTPTNIIKDIQEDSPAYISGLEVGDEIISINNNEIKKWNEIVENISKSNKDEDLNISVERENKKIEFKIKPLEIEGTLIIGISPTMEKSFGKSIKSGFIQTKDFIKAMFEFFRMLFKGKVKSDDLSGPVGVVGAIGEATKMGGYSVLLLMAFISVNLGFFNLLPIPALDGGRLIFLFIELVRGKPIDPDKEGIVHLVGFVLLISLMLFVTYKDIIKLIF